ncbi:MAG: hypothetical protein ACYTEX_11985 [Planctomycetota bacterium]|jgi:hypothetical protein
MDERQLEGQKSKEDLIREAEDAIGRDDPEDYRIQPTVFSKKLASSAPELSAVLGHSSLTETAKRYEEQDAKALTTQELFKRLSKCSTWAVFVATTAAALLASLKAISPNDPGLLLRSVFVLLGLCSLVGGSLAAFILYRVNRERLLQGWMSSRAAAESERLGYFNRLVRRVTERDAKHSRLLLLCLEFIRRYQLAVQQNYYRDRGASHRDSRRKTVVTGAIAAAILAVGAGGFGIWSSINPIVLPLAALGTIGAALTIVASRREELTQDERNAERYQRTYETLSSIRELHSDVQQVVARGNSEVLVQYVNAIHEQLSLEHRQWLAETEAMDSTVKELNSSLKTLIRGGNRKS